MPLDCSLNKDLDDELWRHILYTRFLEEDDPRKWRITRTIVIILVARNAAKRIEILQRAARKAVQD
jgi:hypothetical protein